MSIRNYSTLVFVVVNAGTNNFTNITAKSVLHFHPSAKIFVVDVVPERRFSPLESIMMKNIEVIDGVFKDDIKTIYVDLAKTNLTREEIVVAAANVGKNPLCISTDADRQHTMTIQKMIDNLDCNFIHIDSDAPLIHPVDFVYGCKYATVAQVVFQRYGDGVRNSTVLSEYVHRFYPFIQYFNVDLIKKDGLFFYREDALVDNLDISFQNIDVAGNIIFPTGAYFFKQFIQELIPYQMIDHTNYVNHFGAGSWGFGKSFLDAKNRFYSRYQHLFKNPIPMEEV